MSWELLAASPLIALPAIALTFEWLRSRRRRCARCGGPMTRRYTASLKYYWECAPCEMGPPPTRANPVGERGEAQVFWVRGREPVAEPVRWPEQTGRRALRMPGTVQVGGGRVDVNSGRGAA